MEGNVPAILHLSSFYCNQVDNCVKTKWQLNALNATYYKQYLKRSRQIGRFAGPLRNTSESWPAVYFTCN